MITCLCIIATILAIAMSGFYSGSETGLYSVSRLRMRVEAENGNPAAQRLILAMKDDRAALSTLLVGTNVCNYFATILVAFLLTRLTNVDGSKSELYTTAICTPIVFVFGEVVPKTLFQRYSEILMPMGSRLFAWSTFAFAIPVRVLAILSVPILRLANARDVTESDDHRRNVSMMLQDAFAADEQTHAHGELVDRVFNLTELPLHQVMVPRNHIIALEFRATRQECLAAIRKNAHSRLLVFDKDPRRIVGYVSTHSLLADKNWQSLEAHLEPIRSLAPHQTVAAAMMELQTEGDAIAIIVDRNGRLLGMVTFKDLLEELSGELHDW